MPAPRRRSPRGQPVEQGRSLGFGVGFWGAEGRGTARRGYGLLPTQRSSAWGCPGGARSRGAEPPPAVPRLPPDRAQPPAALGRRGGGGVLETGCWKRGVPSLLGTQSGDPKCKASPGRGAEPRGRAGWSGRGHGARRPPLQISATGELRQGAGRTAAGGVLTWRGAEPARGPGRAAAPSRTSRRGKSRSRAGGGAAEAAAGPPLCPLRRAPAPPPPARLRARRRRGGRGKLGISSARGGGAPCRVLAPRSGARARPRRAGQQLRGGGAQR